MPSFKILKLKADKGKKLGLQVGKKGPDKTTIEAIDWGAMFGTEVATGSKVAEGDEIVQVVFTTTRAKVGDGASGFYDDSGEGRRWIVVFTTTRAKVGVGHGDEGAETRHGTGGAVGTVAPRSRRGA